MQAYPEESVHPFEERARRMKMATAHSDRPAILTEERLQNRNDVPMCSPLAKRRCRSDAAKNMGNRRNPSRICGPANCETPI
jgi:hypothetical protein